MSYFTDVGDFRYKYGLPVFDQRRPSIITSEEFFFRWRLIQEESSEFGTAWAKRDLPEMVDAVCDLVYVTIGAAHDMGINLDAHWAEVQRANMAKVRANGPDDPLGKRGSSLDVVKPLGWLPPDHIGILLKQGW